MKACDYKTEPTQREPASRSKRPDRDLAQVSGLQADINRSPRIVAHRSALQAMCGSAFQCHASDSKSDGPQEARMVPANETGMPDQIKNGVESLSGIDMSDVRVHRNSDKPAQLNALAYARGNDIHLGPGQERHLPHEAWHVVQQRQGRVKETVQMAGVGVNDEAALENEADQMGERLVTWGAGSELERSPSSTGAVPGPIQAFGTPNITEADAVELSPQADVEAAKDEDQVVIARVVTPTQRTPKTTDIKSGLFVSLTKMVARADASVSSASVTNPDAEAVADYVGQKLDNDRVKELIEFTTNLEKINGFAKESNVAYTIYIRIQKKYLTKSDSAEGGWMAKQAAPYEIVKSLKDDKHANVKNESMSNDQLTQALNTELDAEFISYVKTVGLAAAFEARPEDLVRYKRIMAAYFAAKRSEEA